MSRNSPHAERRAGSRTSSINDRGANYFSSEPRFRQRKKKNQKERKVWKGRPVETAAAVEIEKGGLRQFLLDDFHRRLKKPAQERRQLFHSYHRPGGDHHQHFYLFSQRQRSTLSMLFPGPKNGEHVKVRQLA